MAVGLNPYIGSGARSAYAGGFGGGSAFGARPMRSRLPILPDMSEAPNVSPGGRGRADSDISTVKEIGRSSSNPEGVAAGNASMAENNAVASADQARSIAAYRQARDNSQSAQDARSQTTQARDLGIDPSSSAPDIARAASGATNLGATPEQSTGAGTVNALKPNTADVATAAATAQAQKSGQQLGTASSAYAQGYTNATGIKPTGASAFPQPITSGGMAGGAVNSGGMNIRPAEGVTTPTNAPAPTPSPAPVAKTATQAPTIPPPIVGGTINGQPANQVIGAINKRNATAFPTSRSRKPVSTINQAL